MGLHSNTTWFENLDSRLATLLVSIGVTLVALGGAVACSGPRSSAPSGEYHCYGHEAGLLAHAGLLRLEPDGTAKFGQQFGEWEYDEAAQTVEFAGDVPFAKADFDAEDSSLEIELQPGADVTHAERGTLSCELNRE